MKLENLLRKKIDSMNLVKVLDEYQTEPLALASAEHILNSHGLEHLLGRKVKLIGGSRSSLNTVEVTLKAVKRKKGDKV